MKRKDRKEQAKKLLPLLVKPGEELSDREIRKLLEFKEELRELLFGLETSFPRSIEAVQRYRTRKKELAKLSIEELLTRKEDIENYRLAFLITTPEEELPDSFFEISSIDSDEYIIRKILKEREEVNKKREKDLSFKSIH